MLRWGDDVEGKVDGERRVLLKTAALAGVAGAVGAGPLAAYVVAPGMNKGRGKWVDLGGAEGLAARGVKMLAYKFMAMDGWMVLPRQGVLWVRTDADGQLTIFSSICPHLGCVVRFDADGRPIAGPPARSLAVLEHKVEAGKLLVFLPA
jgi:Rieske Fe-S protein